jgi:hypothetical protein
MHHQGPFNAAATFRFVIDEIKMICAVYLVSCARRGVGTATHPAPEVPCSSAGISRGQKPNAHDRSLLGQMVEVESPKARGAPCPRSPS